LAFLEGSSRAVVDRAPRRAAAQGRAILQAGQFWAFENPQRNGLLI
jgi:hypothetical protein